MSSLNRSIRAFLAQNKPPSRIAADLEEFIKEREKEAATCACKPRTEAPFDPNKPPQPTKITKRWVD